MDVTGYQFVVQMIITGLIRLLSPCKLSHLTFDIYTVQFSFYPKQCINQFRFRTIQFIATAIQYIFSLYTLTAQFILQQYSSYHGAGELYNELFIIHFIHAQCIVQHCCQVNTLTVQILPCKSVPTNTVNMNTTHFIFRTSIYILARSSFTRHEPRDRITRLLLGYAVLPGAARRVNLTCVKPEF